MNEVSSRRVPWVALALSFLAAGVGHIYCGRVAKALPLYFAWLLVPICAMIAAIAAPSAIGFVLLLLTPVVVVLLAYLYAALDAWRLAREIGTDYTVADFNRPAVYGLLVVVQLIFAMGLIAGTKAFVYEAFVIPTKNMAPTILPGDRILAKKLLPRDYFPERGELILYRNPTPQGGSHFVGRVVAVAGDEVELQGRRLRVNGKELPRDRVPDEALRSLGGHVTGSVAYEENTGRRYLVAHDDADGEGTDWAVRVPERHVLVLGDNRDGSRDSRHFGPLHAGDVVGRVEYVFWPAETWSRFGLAK